MKRRRPTTAPVDGISELSRNGRPELGEGVVSETAGALKEPETISALKQV